MHSLSKIILLGTFLSINALGNFPAEFTVDQHILINRYYSVSPRHLCHDNVSIYFKSVDDCISGGYSPFLCRDNLELLPIRGVEKIFLNQQEDLFLFRSQKVKLDYETLTYRQNDEGNFNLVEEFHGGQLSRCHEMEASKEAVIYSERETYSNKEAHFLKKLRDSNFFWIVTGPGVILDLKQLDLSSPSINDHFIEKELVEQNIKSPLCSSSIDSAQIWKMSGETSGNGLSKASFDLIEKTAKQIFWNSEKNNGDETTAPVGCTDNSFEI